MAHGICRRSDRNGVPPDPRVGLHRPLLRRGPIRGIVGGFQSGIFPESVRGGASPRSIRSRSGATRLAAPLQRLRSEGQIAGLILPSVRHPGGRCFVAFDPGIIQKCLAPGASWKLDLARCGPSFTVEGLIAPLEIFIQCLRLSAINFLNKRNVFNAIITFSSKHPSPPSITKPRQSLLCGFYPGHPR